MCDENPRIIGQKNRARVWLYFQNNMCATQRDCSDYLGLGRMAVNRHVRAIRGGWEPELNEALNNEARS